MQEGYQRSVILMTERALVLLMFTFAEVVLVIAMADESALPVADSMLAQIESNEVETVRVTMRRTDDPDVAMHDSLVDADPLFLAWDSVERNRRGQSWACFAEGVDSLPAVAS